MELITGKKILPPKVVLYGPEGVGKTTLAAAFPKPLFLDMEGGSARMDVTRVPKPATFPELLGILDELQKDTHGFKTLVIDTADWLDALVQEYVCVKGDDKGSKHGIEDFGYGKGYVYLLETWCKFLDRIGALQRATGMGVVFVAHAIQRKIENPEASSAYDHWELKLPRQVGSKLKEWPDFLLFLHWRTDLEKHQDGKAKATGQTRELCSQHTPWFDAKSREAALKPRFKLDDTGLEHLLACIWQEIDPCDKALEPPKVEPKAEPQKPEPPKTEPVPPPQKLSEKQEHLDMLLHHHGVPFADLDLCVSTMGILPKGTPISSYNDATCDRLIANWEAVKKNIQTIKGK